MSDKKLFKVIYDGVACCTAAMNAGDAVKMAIDGPHADFASHEGIVETMTIKNVPLGEVFKFAYDEKYDILCPYHLTAQEILYRSIRETGERAEVVWYNGDY